MQTGTGKLFIIFVIPLYFTDGKDYCHFDEIRLSFAKSFIFPNIILWLAPAFPSGLCYCHWPRNLSMTVSGYRFSAGSGAR